VMMILKIRAQVHQNVLLYGLLSKKEFQVESYK
jgi:hypothetical protein